MERRRKFGTPRRRVALLLAAAAAVTGDGLAGRRAGAGAGQEDLDLHGHDRVPSHRRHQRRPADHPVAPRGARLHGGLGGLQQPRDPGDQPPADALQPPEPEPAGLHGREPRAVRRDRVPEQLVVVGRRRRRRDRPAARGHAEGRARRLPAERRRHRRDPQHDRRRRGRLGVGLVGRQPELGHRHDDARPRGHQRQRQLRDACRSPTTTTCRRRTCPTRGRSPTSTTTTCATSAAAITCSRRSTSARTRRAPTASARTTRSPGASSTTAPTSTTARRRPRRTTTAARGTPAWATSVSATPRTAATTTWST